MSTVCRSILFSLLSSLLFIFSPPAMSEVYPDMNFEGAVWVAESDGILKVATADGIVLFEIPNAAGTRVAAVDTQRGVLWAYGANYLSAFDFSGTLRARVPVSEPSGASFDDVHTALAVDETDGGVWLGRHKTLYHFSADGSARHVLPLSDKIQALTFDAKRQWLWVSTERALAAYDAQLVIVAVIAQSDAKKILRDISFDTFLDQLWVATDQELIRYDSNGTTTLVLSVRGIEHIAVDGQGGIWIADESTVSHVATSGRIESTVRPTSGKNTTQIIDLVADPSNRTAWVAGNKFLSQISHEGTLLREVDLQAAKVLKGNVRSLALYTDRIAPELSFEQPALGSYLNRNQPPLVFSYSDIGVGVDPKTLAVTANGGAITMTCSSMDREKATCLAATPFPEGSIALSATVKDFAGNKSEPAEVEFTVDTIAPTISVTHPTDGFITNQIQLTVTGTLSEYANLKINGVVVNLGVGYGFQYGPLSLQEGLNSIVLAATDLAGNASSRSVQVTLDTVSPIPVIISQITLSDIVDGKVTVTGSAGSVEGNARVVITNLRTGEKITVTANADGSFSAQIAVIAGDVLSVSVVDAANNASTSVEVRTSVATGLPPDPAAVAPPVDPTVATDILAATAFLYTGANPIQTGVASGTIELRRVAVLRGKVQDRDGRPLPAVQISVLGHPEFGQTLSRVDGAFDLAVNGGGQLTLSYAKDAFLTVQRAIVAPWRDYAWLPDVVMIPFDSAVTAVDLSVPAMQVARGSPVTDADGARQATILFPPGTTATLTLPDGTIQPLTALNVRATEYTVGASGPKAMPGPLPPSSGYTYAVELSVDEAIAAGAIDVRFSQPLPVYIENFLSFPVGGAVPTGYYDRLKGQWIASANGRVIKVLSITSNLADLDLAGTGIAADAAALAALGVTTEERARLAVLYTPGQTLWRVPITHFTPWDCNWPYGPPADAILPPLSPVKPPVDTPEKECGSIIGCEEQTLGESIPVTGTPWRLHYQSERTPGRKVSNTINIPISGATLPASLRKIRVEVSIAGRLYQAEFPPAPNLNYAVTWDGKDLYGRELQGRQAAYIQMLYDYAPQYYGVSKDFTNSFARTEAAGIAVTSSRAASTVTLSRKWTAQVGPWDARAYGLGGWNLSIQHNYDPAMQTLLLGDGRQRSAGALSLALNILTISGNGISSFSGDGGPATAAKVRAPEGVAVGPDGSVYFADNDNVRIRRIGPDGIITTIAGNGITGFSGDGGPATAAKISNPIGVAVGSDGSVYFAENDNARIRRIGPDGIITSFAGTSVSGFSGDGGPATAAQLSNPRGIAVGPDGSVFFADSYNHRIRRVGSDGIITTFAGTSVSGFSGDGGPATAAKLFAPDGVAVGPDGSVFITDDVNGRIRRIGPDGIITTIAGNGAYGFSGDGGPATAAKISNPDGIAVGQDSSVFITDSNLHRIRRIGPDGIITTIAGTSVSGYSGDDGPAAAAQLQHPRGIAVGPDENLYFADGSNNRIRRLRSALPNMSATGYLLTSEDSREVYTFNSTGRHLKTLDALTGAGHYQFDYGVDGYLTSVIDGSGNVATIERAGATPAAIVAPGGQRTGLSVSGDGWLLGIANPAGEAHTMSYSTDGLLQSFADPRGNIHHFTYDTLGRLIKDENPAGGSTTLSRTEQSNGYTVTTTSALGRNRSYKVEQLSTGAIRRSVTTASGAKTITLINTDGSEQTNYPDGRVITVKNGPDPRWGMLAPIANSIVVKTPGGRTRTITTTRSTTLADPLNPFSLTNLTDTVTDNGAVSRLVYNGISRTLTNTTAAGRSSTSRLDALGRMTQQQIAALAPVDYAYDSSGLLRATLEGSGDTSRSTGFAYNATRELSAISDALGRTSNFAYDLAGRLNSQVLPDGRAIQFSYDAAGNATSITPPGRPAHGIAFTPIDQMSTYTPPDVGIGSTETQYVYDLDRALTRSARPDGQVVDLTYDTAGRISTLGFARGLINYTYNPTTAKLTGITAPDGLGLSYSYDGDLLKGVTWTGPVAGTIGFTYNNDFRTTTETVNGANAASFTYDADGLLATAGGLSLTRNTQNGLLAGTALGGVTDSYSYNNLANLSSYGAAYAGSEIYSASYIQDALGRVTQKTEIIGGVMTTFGYTYDAADRLSSVAQNGSPVTTYTYDVNGNRTGSSGPGGAVTATYDAQDRLTVYGGATYNFTANGELRSKTANGQITSYQYDALGNLTMVTLPSGQVIEYLIDGNNRRIGKKVNGTRVQAFLYQGQLRPVAELNGSNNIVSRFVYATHINSPDYMIKGGVTYRLITDQLGSPRLVVNVETGTVAQRIDYDEFGQVLNDTNPGFQPFGYAGGLYDGDTKLVRFGARDYDAETGRWTTKDPIRFNGGDTNLYAYIGNNPLNGTDPVGLATPAGVALARVCWAAVAVEIASDIKDIYDALKKANATFKEIDKIKSECKNTPAGMKKARDLTLDGALQILTGAGKPALSAGIAAVLGFACTAIAGAI